jgi:hypothetical protein
MILTILNILSHFSALNSNLGGEMIIQAANVNVQVVRYKAKPIKSFFILFLF